MRPTTWLLAAGFSLAATLPALAQVDMPASTPDGATLFKRQCATCHSLNTTDAPRQGPTLAGVVGRKPGSVPGYHYSENFAKADFVWDKQHLDAYLTNPQAVIPGSVMPYRQSKAEVRTAVIDYLQQQH